MSGCWSKRQYDMLQKSCIVSGNLRKGYDVNYGQVTSVTQLSSAPCQLRLPLGQMEGSTDEAESRSG